MNQAQRRVAIGLTLATLLGAIGYFKSTGQVQSSSGTEPYVAEFAARAPCGAAKAFAADPQSFDCVAGERVPVLVQVMLNPDGGTTPASFEDLDELPDSVELLRDTFRVRGRARAVRPGKVVTTLNPYDADCIVGEWRNTAEGSAWDGRWQTAWCCRSGCECEGRCRGSLPVHHAGDEDAAVKRALCRAVPEHQVCRDGGVQ